LELPLARWLRGDLRRVAQDVLLDPSALERGVFRPEGVAQVLAQHEAGLDRGQQLWAMLQLELWFRTCVDAPLAGPDQIPVLG
jgi:asparagine synthase (glutamine-hydrolysing)